MDFSKGIPGTYSNLGRVDFTGLEFEGKYYVTRDLYVSASMLYQENRDGNGSWNVTPVAKTSARSGISYRYFDKITVGLFNLYQGDINKRFIDDLNPHQGAYNLLHLHSVIDVNRLFALQFKPGFMLTVNSDNLLDKKDMSMRWETRIRRSCQAIPAGLCMEV